MGATSATDEPAGDTAIAPPAGVPGPIRLVLPSDPAMSRIARLTASAIASLAGCTMDELQNVKIAVSEALIVLIEHGDGNEIDLEFSVGPDALAVSATSRVAGFDAEQPGLALCRVVLDDVTDQYTIEDRDGTAAIVLRIPLSAGDHR